jgi:hypothetical protein
MSSSSGTSLFPAAYEQGGMVIPSCAQANNIDLGNFFQSRAIGGKGKKGKSKKGKKSSQKKTRKHNRGRRRRYTMGGVGRRN